MDANADKSVAFLVERNGRQVEMTAVPRMNETEGRVMIGVGLDAPLKETASLTETLSMGARYTGMNIRATAFPAGPDDPRHAPSGSGDGSSA